MSFRDDDRGVSRLVSYMLTVSVAMILITGLLFAGSQLVQEQRDRTTYSQLDVIGHQIAGSLEAADRLVQSTADGPDYAGPRPRELNLRRSLPTRAVDTLYTIEVEPDEIILEETGPGGVSVAIPYRTETTVATGTVNGGPIVIEYKPSSDELVVRDA